MWFSEVHIGLVVLARFHPSGNRASELKAGLSTIVFKPTYNGNSGKQGKKLLGTLTIIIDEVNLGVGY